MNGYGVLAAVARSEARRNRIVGGIGVAWGVLVLGAFLFRGGFVGPGLWFAVEAVAALSGVVLFGYGVYTLLSGSPRTDARAALSLDTSPLLHRLAIVRRRYRIVTLASGIFATAAFVLGVVTLVGLTD